MNKLILWVGVVIVVIIAVVAYFIMARTGTNSSEQSGETSQQEESAEEVSGLQSLKDLLASGNARQCSFSDSADSSSTNGTVYIAEGKVRGDFSSVSAGQTMASHMIADGQTSYIWTDGSTSGFKMTVSGNQPANSTQAKSLDQDKKIDYKCSPWSVNSSYFDLPAGVEFTDMSALVPQQVPAGATGSNAADVKAKQCAICNNAPDDARSKCLVALGCN